MVENLKCSVGGGNNGKISKIKFKPLISMPLCVRAPQTILWQTFDSDFDCNQIKNRVNVIIKLVCCRVVPIFITERHGK